MTKIDLGQAVGILANVGVIAGIVFLGVELQQNNDLLGIQTRAIQLDQTLGFAEEITRNPTLAAVIAKAESNEELSAVEEVMLRGLAMRGLRQLEWSFNESQAGTFAMQPEQVALYRAGFRGDGIFRWPLGKYWADMDDFFSPNFVRFVEENVINE